MSTTTNTNKNVSLLLKISTLVSKLENPSKTLLDYMYSIISENIITNKKSRTNTINTLADLVKYNSDIEDDEFESYNRSYDNPTRLKKRKYDPESWHSVSARGMNYKQYGKYLDNLDYEEFPVRHKIDIAVKFNDGIDDSELELSNQIRSLI